MAPKRTASSKAGSVFRDPALRHPTVERAEEINADLPYERLRLKLNTASKGGKTRNVVHWFRTKDLRAEDNRGLATAADLASNSKDGSSKLLCLFILQPSELDWHGVGLPRRRFLADNLHLLSEQLKKLEIPLVPILSESHKDTAHKLVSFAKKNDVSHVVANFEYEYDEINRDIEVAAELEAANIGFQLIHDQTVVEPGLVTNNNGEPKKVFTPYWNSWTPLIAKDPKKYYLDLAPVPGKQAGGAQVTSEPSVDLEAALGLDGNDKELGRIAKLWPPGHDAAVSRLEKFAETKIAKYGELRSVPAEDCVSRMSPYFAAGIISVREALAIVRKKANSDKNFGTSTSGVDSWIREVAFRDFYRQMVAAATPHIVMNMPSILKLTDMENDENEEAWKRWCEGMTGVPFIDAGMRQLNEEGYMHNRLRMNVSSYLRMNLMLDFRLGMRYFANKLVDWDCCNNCFGWDPSYTVFNPVTQAEKLDRDAEYIKKWVPELRGVEGKAIFDPANRLSEGEFAKLNYPRPMVDQQTAKERSVQRMKDAGAKRVKKEED